MKNCTAKGLDHRRHIWGVIFVVKRDMKFYFNHEKQCSQKIVQRLRFVFTWKYAFVCNK